MPLAPLQAARAGRQHAEGGAGSSPGQLDGVATSTAESVQRGATPAPPGLQRATGTAMLCAAGAGLVSRCPAQNKGAPVQINPWWSLAWCLAISSGVTENQPSVSS